MFQGRRPAHLGGRPERRPSPASARSWAPSPHGASHLQIRSPTRASRLPGLVGTYLGGCARQAGGHAAAVRFSRACTNREVGGERRTAGVSGAAVAHFARCPGLHHSPKIGRQVWEAGSGAHCLGHARAPHPCTVGAPHSHQRRPLIGPHPPRYVATRLGASSVGRFFALPLRFIGATAMGPSSEEAGASSGPGRKRRARRGHSVASAPRSGLCQVAGLARCSLARSLSGSGCGTAAGADPSRRGAAAAGGQRALPCV